MAKQEVNSARVQVYLTDPKVISALNREAKVMKAPLSQAAGKAIARGLKRSVPADPDDRLLRLERGLRDHMRSTSRDLQIVEELLVEIARALFLRMPDVQADEDPTVQAAVERRIDRMLDAAAARIVRGRPADSAIGDEGRPPLAAAE